MTTLFSVTDQTGLVPFAQRLHETSFISMVATGDAYKTIREAPLPCASVSEFTGAPSILGGRVETLTQSIFGSIVTDWGHQRDASECMRLKLQQIHMVVANLGDPFITPEINKIDIGTHALLRAAATNYRLVIVVCDPADYSWIAERFHARSPLTPEERFQLAAKAFDRTAGYDMMIADRLHEQICRHQSSTEREPQACAAG